MTQGREARYREMVAKHPAMNVDTSQTLCLHTGTELTALRLDFTFIASDQKHAQALMDVLEAETDNNIEVRSEGSFLRRHWTVMGSTKPTAL